MPLSTQMYKWMPVIVSQEKKLTFSSDLQLQVKSFSPPRKLKYCISQVAKAVVFEEKSTRPLPIDLWTYMQYTDLVWSPSWICAD